MFTGIIETLGKVTKIAREGGNLHISVVAPFLSELKVDQSIAHNGACLTVIKINPDSYTVTAVDETLRKTNLGELTSGDSINLERCMKLGDRLDGHIVQGHVDLTGICTMMEELDGSWKFSFSYDKNSGHVTVPKGSICVNGVSLTVVDSAPGTFSVVVIPFTHQHTTFKFMKPGDEVNLEFDVIGKYVAALVKQQV